MNAAKSSLRMPAFQRRSGLSGASLIRILRSDLARTSTRVPVRTQKRSGERRRFTVVSTIASQPPMIADELRRQADVFTDLAELQSKLGRDPSERPAPREPRHHPPQFLQRATTTAP